MRRFVPLLAAAFVCAACGEAPQQGASPEPYSAQSSRDARGQPGYSENPTQWDQVEGEDTGRASAATGASDQGLSDLPAGDAPADSEQQPEPTP